MEGHRMLKYDPELKQNARNLRTKMTDSEQRLWSRLRRKQLSGVQFYRQKPIGGYIVDFYAPKAKLVVEVDGSQHLEATQMEKDGQRNVFLESQGLRVLRFGNHQVLQELDKVLQVILRAVAEGTDCGYSQENPP